jgi:hypothetical protein
VRLCGLRLLLVVAVERVEMRDHRCTVVFALFCLLLAVGCFVFLRLVFCLNSPSLSGIRHCGPVSASDLREKCEDLGCLFLSRNQESHLLGPLSPNSARRLAETHKMMHNTIDNRNKTIILETRTAVAAAVALSSYSTPLSPTCLGERERSAMLR